LMCVMLFLGIGTGISQEQIKVTGTVRRADSTSASPRLSGVSITVKSSNQSTVTDRRGFFEIDLSNEESVLVFIYLGYSPQEIVISNQRELQVVLEPSDESIDEVVVVGYGTQRKSDLTGSVGVVSGEELLQAPVNNALQGLKG